MQDDKKMYIKVPCKLCVRWIPKKEDSTESEFGLCPIRCYPRNWTHADFVCFRGILAEAFSHRFA